MVAKGLGRYRHNQLMTASPGEILLSLYDGALRFAQQARVAMLAGKVAEKGVAIGRVIAIVSEFERTLNHDRAPALCDQLDRLYRYLRERLLLASAKLEVATLDEVIAHLSGLRDSWQTAVRGQSASSANP